MSEGDLGQAFMGAYWEEAACFGFWSRLTVVHSELSWAACSGGVGPVWGLSWARLGAVWGLSWAATKPSGSYLALRWPQDPKIHDFGCVLAPQN